MTKPEIIYFERDEGRTPEYLAQVLRLAEDVLDAKMLANATGTLARHDGVYGKLDEALRLVVTEYVGSGHGRPADEVAEQVMHHLLDSGESVTYIVKQLHLHHEQKGVRFSGHLVFADGSGDRTGWVDVKWDPTDVSDLSDNPDPLLFTKGEAEPAAWLASTLREWLGAIDGVDISNNERRGTSASITAADARTHEEGHTVRLTAHPFGFTSEQITRAVQLAGWR